MAGGRNRSGATADGGDVRGEPFIPHPGRGQKGQSTQREQENDGDARVPHRAYRKWGLPPERVPYLDPREEYGLGGQPVKEAADGHYRDGVGIGYLKPVCGALAWARGCDAEGAVVVTEEGPFVPKEHAGQERVVG